MGFSKVDIDYSILTDYDFNREFYKGEQWKAEPMEYVSGFWDSGH